ncbi:MAG: response regulator [Pseudobdellovibrio sp.]
MFINAPIRNKLIAENFKNVNQQILNNMSLEIRNPMNSILGYAELLANEECTPEEKFEFLSRINSSCTQLMNLIDTNYDTSPPQAILFNNIETYSQMNFNENKILLVEDSADNSFLISHYINNLGFEIHIATDGLEAVKMASQQNYACILMDLQMPGINGLEATRRIRKQGYTNPIIALTAYSLPEELVSSLDAGCNLHLTKPIDKYELISAINLQLQNFNLN